MTKVHAIRTGSVRIKIAQMSRRGHGLAALGHILIDRDWSDWVPIYAWLIEHDEGLILVDTGETARVHQRGYHPRWHPFFRRASQFQVTPEDVTTAGAAEAWMRAVQTTPADFLKLKFAIQSTGAPSAGSRP